MQVLTNCLLVVKGFAPIIWLTNEKSEYSYTKMVDSVKAKLQQLHLENNTVFVMVLICYHQCDILLII